jgi:hypothetical protein
MILACILEDHEVYLSERDLELQSIAKTASTLLIAFLFSGPTAKALA